MQTDLPKFVWRRYGADEALVHELSADNSWLFKYLGSIFELGGGHMTDVRARIAMARTRFRKLRHI